MNAREILPMLLTWTPYLGVGFLINIGISLLTMVIGTALGFLLARGRQRSSGVAAFLTAAARVPPTFVLIYYLAYVVPPEIPLGAFSVPLPDWLKASLALAVAVTGFVSDNALSALRHLERGERVEALYFIPAWTTYLLIIIMASSTASVIGVPEIVQRANTVIAAVGDPRAILWIYLYTMLWFLVLCWPLARLMGYAKLRLSQRAGTAAGARVDLGERSALAEDSLQALPEGDVFVSGQSVLDLTFDLPVSNDSIATIQSGVEEAGEGVLDSAAVFRLSLAVEELVTNVVKYGGASDGRLAVAIYRRPDEVTVELGYGGDAFDPFRDAPEPDLDAPLETRPVGGLGVHLISNMIDRAYYRRQGDRNTLRLVMMRSGTTDGGIVP
ncbi:ATP-binding protein [Mesorhizobium sp. BR1-1-16]|uniref:ATP-binding protein n=1 Tax=Mesorhizobium sp. BR1-1-16 TaxID=2876653 RepID=UPI001CC9A8AF|nr:ATP-binding protein [Mesorhizobium sp. BR1-1-16]MBZ9938352.1 ATP-binding protein [Mesorhizobium sp. BR1-1-16]